MSVCHFLLQQARFLPTAIDWCATLRLSRLRISILRSRRLKHRYPRHPPTLSTHPNHSQRFETRHRRTHHIATHLQLWEDRGGTQPETRRLCLCLPMQDDLSGRPDLSRSSNRSKSFNSPDRNAHVQDRRGREVTTNTKYKRLTDSRTPADVGQYDGLWSGAPRCA